MCRHRRRARVRGTEELLLWGSRDQTGRVQVGREEREREKERVEAAEEEEEEMGMEGGRRYWQEQRQGGKER